MKNIFLIVIIMFSFLAFANPPNNTKSKFYDFSEQMIDGEIRTPTGTYLNTREKAKFDRLLRLKKSFFHKLFSTSKEKVFK
jgi:hypothetical protein